MHDLIISPLHKCGVNITERNKSLSGKPSRESDCMLLSYADIKSSVWHGFHHDIHGRARRHRWGNTHDSIIHFCQFHQGVSKNILILWSLWDRRDFLEYFSGYFIKSTWGMPSSFISVFRRSVSFSFYSDTMKDFWSRNVSHVFENLD